MKILLLIVLLTALQASAQELPEIDTDRPDQTESSSVLPVSTLQIEAGLHTEGDKLLEVRSLPAMLVRYGVLDWLELRAIAEFWGLSHVEERFFPGLNRSGSTFGVGTKIQLSRENGAFPEIALLAHLTKGSETLDSGSTDLVPDFRFSMGHSLPLDFALGYNLGGEWSSTFQKMIGVYTVALGFPIGSEFGGYVELFGDYDEELTSSFDAGVTFAPANNLQIDLSAGSGLDSSTPDYYLGVGVSYRYPN